MLAWGNIPWVYVLARRLPATPYTSALRDPPVPGETDALRRSLIGGSPVAVVVVDPPAPPLGRAARSLRLHYRRVTRIGNSTVYVRR
jgi:hypothetical protein